VDFYTRGDSACGSVRVQPPEGWPSRGGGRPTGGWSVGGTVYRTWREAWRGSIGGRATSQGPGSGRVPSAASYLRAWSVDHAAGVQSLDELAELVSPPRVVTGIDLAVRGVEVRRLLYAGFGFRLARAGYDPEEVLQEVYRGILVRNRGKCPFDVRKSSFGHYVHMVIECILSNYHRKESRRRESEGSWEDLPEGQRERAADGVGAGGWSAQAAERVGGSDGMAVRMVSDAVRRFPGLTGREGELALGVLPLLQAGHAATPRGAKEAGWSWPDWRDGVAVLRRVVGGCR